MDSHEQVSKKKGSRGGNQIQSLQNRVRDAFRRRLRWGWTRESGWRDDTEAASKRWAHFSPTAVRKFRSLFSSGQTSNASRDGPETCINNVQDVMTPTNTDNTTKKYHNIEPEMVNTKTEEKKGVGRDTAISSGNGESLQCDIPPTVPGVAVQEEVMCSQSTSAHTKTQNHNAATSCIILAKASDGPNIISLCTENESCDSTNFVASNCIESLQDSNVSSPTCLEDVQQITKSSASTSRAQCIDKYKPELPETSEESPVNNVANQCIVIAPSIILNETNAKTLPIENSKNTKKLPDPLCLNLEPGRTSPSLTRKSPVTVQEWVDSLPSASQIEDDPEPVSGPAVVDAVEHGDICPSVKVQPALSQTSTVADQRREAFSRDASPSLQSDTGSHGSSVDSYLEARKPDPEEVLLGLGFGGSIHAPEAEVSRIPARFLQPSKVKGVEIDDFLRYQQDLIETFESGYSGYRGLTGGAQIPSVIVAKIMEKLREHERESSVKSSAGSSPGHHAELTRRRFSRAAQRISILTKMKSRDSIASSPGQAHSVLNPDNRKFLDNQGSKSPEMSRKRMIIGHRSFTFDGDGQLIETEMNVVEEAGSQNVSTSKPPPSSRPLVHNDSIISSATSQSMTSYDSDSDIDEISGHQKRGNLVLQRLYSSPAATTYNFSGAQLELARNQMDYICEEIASSLMKRRKSLPSATNALLNDSPERSIASQYAENVLIEGSSKPEVSSSPIALTESSTQNVHHNQEAPERDVAGQRISSTQDLAQRNSVVNEETVPNRILASDEDRFSQSGIQRTDDLEGAPFNRISDFSLPEDQNIHKYAESPGSFTSDSQYERYLLKMNSIPKSSAMYLDKETRRRLSLTLSSDSFEASSPVRAQNWSTSSVSSWECEATGSPIPESRSEETSPVINIKADSSTPICPSASRNSRRGSLKRQQNVDEDDSAVKPSVSLNIDHLKALDEIDKGDSFEMEELEQDSTGGGRVTRTGSAQSDSSGFQEGSCPAASASATPAAALLSKQLSESEPLLSAQRNCVVDVQTVEHLKRLSLPVIRVQDESGLLQWRAESFHGDERQSCSSSLRRSRSLPGRLFRLGDCVSPGSIADSIGNMFSSCSDDSVIHLPRRSGDAAAFPLLVAVSDHTCEQGTRCATQYCRERNITLRKSLTELHSNSPFALNNQESWKCIHRDLHSLQEAQIKIRNIVEHMEGHICSMQNCNMKAVLEKVSDVALHQSDLCSQLEMITSDAHKLAGVLNPCDFSNSCCNSCSIAKKCAELISCQLHHSDNMCQSLCKVIQEENRRLQDVVQQNVYELAEIRKLLQTLLVNTKE